MNTRSIAFSLAIAVGICFAASHVKADDSVQPDEITQHVGEPLDIDQCRVERTDLPAWMICEGWMPYEEIIAVDEVIEETVAEKAEHQEAGGMFTDDEIVCANESTESKGISVAEEAAVDELFASDEVVSEETEQVDVEAVQVFDAEVVETEETFGETVTAKDVIQEFKCVEGFDGWIVERDFEAEGLAEEKDESFEPEAVVGEETVQVDADDAGQIFDEAATDESRTTEEEIFANEELTGGSIWIAVFDANFDEGGFAADESTPEETTVEETIEAIESAAVEGNAEIAESAVEEATLSKATDNVETEELAVAQTTEEVAINGDLALDAEASIEESFHVEASAGALPEESLEQQIDEEITVEETVDAAEAIEVDSDIEALETAIEEATAVEESVGPAEVLEVENAVGIVEPTIEEETAVEETVEATDDVASPVAVETLDEESFEQEAVEEVQDAIDAYEDLTSDGVVDNEETLEVVEPLIEEAELPETASESTAGDDVSESETGTVRTIELGGCEITIQSDRQMDDFELLDMLWEAVDQLEAEMD